MKKIFVIQLCFINSFCFAQKIINKHQYYFKKSYTSSKININTPTVYFNNYKIGTTYINLGELNPIKIYSKSSTIFDISYIILLNQDRFVASYAGCTQKTISGGSYQIKNNQLILKCSRQIFNTINKLKSIDELKYQFIDIGKIKYLLTNEGLAYIAQ